MVLKKINPKICRICIRFGTGFYVLISLFLAGCAQVDDHKTTSNNFLYSEVPIAAVDLKKGYHYNVLTNDTIEALISEKGEEILTGVPVKANGKYIYSDSVARPFVRQLSPPLLTVNPHKNVNIIPKNLPTVVVNKNALTQIDTTLHKDFILTGETGDTIPTGIPIPVSGSQKKVIQPKLVKAFPPRFKDNVLNNMKYLDVDQGMSSSYVLSMLQDKRGDIWFGTWGGGVSWYDGHSFKHFSKENGLTDNTIWAIHEDRKGNIWFGTNKQGVICYDGISFTYYQEKDGLCHNSIRCILEDNQGNLWFGSDGGGATRYDGHSFVNYTRKEGLGSNVIWSMIEDASGRIWFGSYGGGATCYSPDYLSEEGAQYLYYNHEQGLSNDTVLSLLEDRFGNIWIGTRNNGVNCFDGNVITHYSVLEGLSDNSVWDMVEDHHGNIWFATEFGGICCKKGDRFVYFTTGEGLCHNTILTMIEDANGGIWCGSNGGGVSQYNEDSFSHFILDECRGNTSVRAIEKDKNGDVWFAITGGGVCQYRDSVISQFTESEGLISNYIMFIMNDSRGNLWFASFNNGVACYDGKELKHYTREQGLCSNAVISILEDSNGNIWFGTNGGGVSCYNPRAKTDNNIPLFTNYTQEGGLTSNLVFSLLEDKTGNIWMGTYGGGITRYTAPGLKDGHFIHFTEKEGLSDNVVSAIHEDAKGNIWIGTNHGVNIYTHDSIVYYTEKQGLSNNIVQSIIEDQDHHFWVGTDAGLNQLTYCTEENTSEGVMVEEIRKLHIKSFLKQDGLKGQSFFSNSVFLDTNVQLWWGSENGIEKIDLTYSSNSSKPLVTQLNSLEINEQIINYNEVSDQSFKGVIFDSVQKFSNYAHHLEMPHHINHLTFHFSAVDWLTPHDIRYSYMIEGLNDVWSKASSENKADYRNIPYGSYIFKVRAVSKGENWGEVFSYPFTIHPPWWQTWWARGIYILLLWLGIFLFSRWRTLKLKKRKTELEVEVKAATDALRVKNDELIVKNREITDSIDYAKRIQSAILSPIKVVKDYLFDSFILYMPKDIVAGDFYWMQRVDGKILFAAADCTGHGVPGAMVSVVCNNALNRSVREYRLTVPGQILDKTREIVVEEFEKSDEFVRDGMDIALCSLNRNTLQYAGAYCPLWVISKGELKEIKADKQPVGFFDNPTPYTTHTISLNKGDIIYIFSDGFADQFGGEKGKKFMAKSFKRLLISIHDKPMDEQRRILRETVENWRGDIDQIDDICIIGVKI